MKKCLNCDKEIINEKNIFCNKSCAAAFNNKKRKGTYKRKQQSIDKQKETNKNLWNSKRGEKLRKIRSDNAKRIMQENKVLKDKAIKRLKKSDKNTEKQKQTIRKKIESGEWNTWKSRKIRSYPELITEDWLRKNDLFENCIVEHSVLKKDLGINERGNYFLDFYFFDKKIDLEIDGSQHKEPERKKLDKKRDKYLRKNGIIVIRIEVVNFKNKHQSKIFFDKLNKFKNKFFGK